jgi:UDP-N-acetylmuramate-alanine ligase
VAEADESDRSFLKLSPRFAVITNIDREHLAYGSFDDLKAAFVQFANSVRTLASPCSARTIRTCARSEPRSRGAS